MTTAAAVLGSARARACYRHPARTFGAIAETIFLLCRK